MLTQLALAAPVLVVGALLQTVAGFGIGLIAVPLLLWLGFSLPESVALVLGGGVVQTAAGLFKVHRAVPWRSVLPLASVQWLTIPAGVLTMRLVLEGQQALTKQVVGAALLALLGVRLLVRLEPRERVHWAWGLGAAGAAGFLGGLVGMGGPPLVLYAQSHRWSKDRFRGFLWAIFLLATPVLLLFLSLHAGVGVLRAFVIGLALAPFLWLGTWLGLVLTRRWEVRQVQRAATTLLVAVGLSSVLGPLLF